MRRALASSKEFAGNQREVRPILVPVVSSICRRTCRFISCPTLARRANHNATTRATNECHTQSCVTEGYLYDGAVMITASHLPSHRNGFKFFTQSGGLNKQDIAEVLLSLSKEGF